MRPTCIAAILALSLLGCSDPPGKENGTDQPVDAGTTTDTGSSADEGQSRVDGSVEDDAGGGVGDPCPNGAADCASGLNCKSDEEARFNFCGAQTVPDCDEGFIGDDCGNCFQSCTTADECPDDMGCNGTYCIGDRTCREEQLSPP